MISFLQHIRNRLRKKARDKGEKRMNTTVLQNSKWDIEKIVITAGMLFMEGAGMFMLICGMFNIKIL